VTEDKLWDTKRVIDEQKLDVDLAPIYSALAEGREQPSREEIALESADTKTYWFQWPMLELRAGLLCRKFVWPNGRVTWQLIPPRTYRGTLMRVIHGTGACHHLGLPKTIARVQEVAYWAGYRKDVAAEIQRCGPCNQFHRGKPPKNEGLHSYLAGEPWERISMDITGRHPKSNSGNSYILTIIDHFTRYAFAYPIRDHTALTVGKVLLTKVFPVHGFPLQLLADNGPEFNSQIFSDLQKFGNVEGMRSISYHPASNGTSERLHRTLNSLIGKGVDDQQRNWDLLLPHLMAAYNGTRHSTTGFSPHFLMFGRDLRQPVDVTLADKDDFREWEGYDDFVSQQGELMNISYRLVREQTGQVVERRKDRYSLEVKSKKFQVGDWVWRYYPRRYRGKTPKWQRLYGGPWQISKVISPSCVAIQKSPGTATTHVHVDQLKMFRGEMPNTTPSLGGGNPERRSVNKPSRNLAGGSVGQDDFIDPGYPTAWDEGDSGNGQELRRGKRSRRAPDYFQS
jgi:transposase InsO family protein